MKLFISISIFSLFFLSASGQTVDTALQVPRARQLFHDNIDKAQRKINQLPRLSDSVKHTGGYEVDAFQVMVENDPKLEPNEKITWLRGMAELLGDYVQYVNMRQLRSSRLPSFFEGYTEALMLNKQGESILPAMLRQSLETASLLSRNFALKDNVGMPQVRQLITFKELQRYPDRAMIILNRNPELLFGDSIIYYTSRRNPEELYNYAAARNALAARIAAHPDPLVQMISRLSKMPTGRQYFPFLDNLYRGKQTMEEITTALEDSVKYYKLLVNTQIAYNARLLQRDTPIVMRTLTNKLRTKAKETFVTIINGLHDEKDAVWFRSLAPLTAPELYYLCVMGDEEIYTSSYLGVYKRIWEKMKQPSADSLLMQVYFGQYKKFIRMAAGYNTLDDFLGRMKPGNATMLMNAFVSGLDKTGSLEDAVDVADSYASINAEPLRKQILAQVGANLQKTTAENNARGKQIYGILNTIFQSAEPGSTVDVAALLGIPPVYTMPQQLLRDSAGKVVIEQYFYGDKDGQFIFGKFLNDFRAAGWKVQMNDQFATVSSQRGTPVVIYANRPLDETKDLDAQAQQAMNDYLDKRDIQPSIVIHRGHSYYLPSTIEQLSSSAKVIILGSCGGYNNLSQVLSISPEAHIIASKQVGTGLINSGMINTICETLRQGQDLQWVSMWKKLGKSFGDNAQFDDYVPPHKNLGAIFITAYNRAEDREN